jgi:hypothetical protein
MPLERPLAPINHGYFHCFPWIKWQFNWSYVYILLSVQHFVHYAFICIDIYSVYFLDFVIQIFIVPLFNNWLCLIIVVIVHLTNTGTVFQVFWSRNQHQQRKSIKIIHHKICAWFWLSIGFLKSYCHHCRKSGCTEPISLTWGRSGRDKCSVSAPFCQSWWKVSGWASSAAGGIEQGLQKYLWLQGEAFLSYRSLGQALVA